MDMFADTLIPNDLSLVCQSIDTYYTEEVKEVPTKTK
jgi:hypothetical protein